MNCEDPSNLTPLLLSAASALVAGTAFVLSLFNYRRDRPAVEVRFQWDLTLITPFANAIPNQPVAAVTARNLGRRPIYIGLAGLQYYPTPFERLKKRLTKKWPDNTFCQVIQKSLSGIKLGEGDPPARFDFNQDNAALSKHSKYWKRVRGFVEDSAGQFYFSPSVDPRPSWAGGRPWKPSR